MQMARMLFFIVICGIFSLNAMQKSKERRLQPGVYLREVVNNTPETIRISSVALNFAPDISGFRAKHNKKNDYICTLLRKIAPGQKAIWSRQIIEIPNCVGILADQTLLEGAQLRVETLNSEMDEHYWLIREWNEDGTCELDIKRRPTNGKKLVQISHEKQTFNPEVKLITFVKIILEKPDLLGIRMSTQTSEHRP